MAFFKLTTVSKLPHFINSNLQVQMDYKHGNLQCHSPGANKNQKHGEKESFEEYSLNLASTELSFPILINYLAGKCQTY
jgi:hypothetical protein